MHLLTLAAVALFAIAPLASAQTILKPADTEKLLPATVYYKGQSAPIQLRNSSGIKFPDGSYILAALVDTSGYASDVASKYQAYFITEVPLHIAGQSLPAGIYGAGFVSDNKFILTDVGGHDVLTAASTTAAAIRHPLPLQFISDPSGGFRLYSGRRFIMLSR